MGPIAPELLGRLYREHAPALRLYARQWCVAAEDVVQEAFIRLAQQAVAPEQPLAWLYRVVRNEALQISRAESRRRRREAQASATEAWFSRVDEAIDSQHATAALAELPLDLREVIVARIWGGLNLEAIADLAGCSVATVHRRYQEGLARLHERLEGQCTRTTGVPTT